MEEEEEEGGGGDKLPPVDDACFYTGITVKEEPQEPVPVKMPLKAAADDDGEFCTSLLLSWVRKKWVGKK